MDNKALRHLAISLALLSSITCHAATVQMESGSVCWPLHFSGITLGVTNDSQVVRLLGSGKVHDLGDGVVRYFVDRERRATLYVVMYTDKVTGTLTVLDGIDPTLIGEAGETPVSEYFDPTEGFGNWHALHLGSTKEDVLRNLGAPKKKNNDNEWVYSTNCSCEIPNYFSLFFRNEHIFKIVFSAPAG